MLKVTLGSLGAFQIFENLVSRRQVIIHRNGTFGHRTRVLSVYRILVKLNASGNSGSFVVFPIINNLVSRKRQVLEPTYAQISMF